jgi:hypothetical protein
MRLLNKTQWKAIIFMVAFLVFTGCSEEKASDNQCFDEALQNGKLANEAFTRSLNYVKGWITFADEETGLIPRNLQKDTNIWNAHDAAADNYPFMVLTAAITDQSLFTGRMQDMLRTEEQLTSRIGSLPDVYSFEKDDFEYDNEDPERIIFGASEYMKDGLLPLTEYLGSTAWSERMLDILNDLGIETGHGPVTEMAGQFYGDSPVEEVNGELMQVLCRMYWMTDNNRYLEWAEKIGDYYLLGNHHPTHDLEKLRLRDHGCEVIAGLSELYFAVSQVNEKKKNDYKQPLHEMLDRILENGRNEDGLFYDVINPQTGDTIIGRIADTWGYILNAYYTVYLVDKRSEYLEAVKKALSTIPEYKNHNWEGNADGYADAIESAINLFNRLPEERVAAWIDSEIKIMWGMQKKNGVIEGWHGDGNFARTSVMYALMKTAGTTIKPWREDVIVGSVLQDSIMYISMKSDTDWEGLLMFDRQRHKDYLHLPVDYPRINQFQEWFTIKKHEYFRVENRSTGEIKIMDYDTMKEGLLIKSHSGKRTNLVIQCK